MRNRIPATIAIFMFLTTTILAAQPHEGQKGDANNDGNINFLDMLTVANHALGIVYLDEEGLWRADVNGPTGNCEGDGNANVLDMVKMANIILGNDQCPTASCSTVTDIDGNIYQTVQIGDQCWMVENLKVTRYRNGDAIQGCWSYDNNAQNAEIYGRLYDWYAVNDSRKIAPAGWCVPTDNDWKELEIYLGMNQSQVDATGNRGTDEGGKMKDTGTIEAGNGLWYSPNTGATNSSGFSALPAGYYGGYFSSLGNYAGFWSATESGSGLAWYRSLGYYGSGIYRYDVDKGGGFSVRCLRDLRQ